MRGLKGLKFKHHGVFEFGQNQQLMSSYHPSRQNTNTGRLKWDDWLGVFQDIQKRLG